MSQGKHTVHAWPRLSCSKYVAARDAWFSRLSDVFAGRSSGKPFFANGVVGSASADPYQEPDRWVNECLDSLEEKAEVLTDPHTMRLLVVQCDIYGVHFIDRMFGARVFLAEHGWWADTLPTPVGSLRPPDLETDNTWRVAKTMVRAFLDSGVTVPVFGLPTIANALNIAVNLYNDRFLLALLTDPEAAHHDLRVINNLLCELHRWYLAHLPLAQLQPVIAARRVQPPGFGQLCGCTTHLISAQQYREYVAELDNDLLATYENGGMIHLCGAHTQHIPIWREMPALRAVQLNDRAAEDLEIYYQNLRDDQIIYVRPTRATNLARIEQITGGRRIVIMGQAPMMWER